MTFPSFFDQVPRITLRDPLADFLGAADGGVLDYGYADAVRLAGHSCPTVAMAYALTVKGLRTLYGEALPERGGLRASFRDAASHSVTGVLAAVVGLITGAAEQAGFKGIGGRFGRCGLLRFAVPMLSAFQLQGEDGRTVALDARLERVPSDPETGDLLSRCLSGAASPEERAAFRELWQGRVRRLLVDHWDDAEVWQVVPQ